MYEVRKKYAKYLRNGGNKVSSGYALMHLNIAKLAVLPYRLYSTYGGTEVPITIRASRTMMGPAGGKTENLIHSININRGPFTRRKQPLKNTN